MHEAEEDVTCLQKNAQINLTGLPLKEIARLRYKPQDFCSDLWGRLEAVSIDIDRKVEDLHASQALLVDLLAR
ncbi:hypothetical protein CO612_09525 [Lysobacteraceae bacterium NML71-0210]|nr:hypothetical protein CO612_09525 [Xanthomonadaceae bacterium NML71-0210]